MTAITPRVPRVPRVARFRFRLDGDHALGRAIQRIAARRRTLARPPAFLVVCATVAVLNIVGLVMILSASSVAALSDYGSAWYFFERQVMWAAFGLVAFVIAARVDYQRWRRWTPALFGATALLLVAVLVVSEQVNQSHRWFGLGSFGVQPSELAKLGFLLAAAQILTLRADRLHDQRAWRPVLVLFGVVAFLVMLEPDLTSTLVITVIFFALLIVGGVPGRDLGRLAGLGFLGVLALAWMAPYRRSRMLSFLHPSRDPLNATLQIRQSLIALGSGGLNGVGLGAGRAKWLFLPNAHTDFIFAIVGEELGFVGCLLVLGLFAGFALVGFHIARRAPDRFGMLVATGVTAWIAGEAVINLGAVVGVLPVSGVPLPFLSVGGSSLVITMFGAGILANIARQTIPTPKSRPVKAQAARRS